MEEVNTKLKGRLERLVIISVRNIQRQNDKFVTVTEVLNYLKTHYDKKYYPQTITTVLKRLYSKKLVDRYYYGANRCAYYDPRIRSGSLPEIVWEKFQEFADDLYFGNLEEALESINDIVIPRIKQIKAKENLLDDESKS